MEFQEFPKIARLEKDCVVTEKLDGTNAQIQINTLDSFREEQLSKNTPEQRIVDLWESELFKNGSILSDVKITKMSGYQIVPQIIRAGSRNRYLTKEQDNYGFYSWVEQNKDELVKLGPGRHYGEWWGLGIQRGYDLFERRFSLFNAGKWTAETLPKCCHVVPILYEGTFNTVDIYDVLDELKEKGSKAAPGYMNPEGIIIYHTAARTFFKKTYEDNHKGYY